MAGPDERKGHIGKIRGSTGVPYGLIVGLISIVALGSITAGGSAIDNLFSSTSDTLGAVADPSPSANPSASSSPVDDTPDSFDFVDAGSADLSTQTMSDIVLINGITGPASLSVSGDGSPQYRTCADAACSSELVAWGSSGDVINDGEYVQLRLTSSSANSTASTATLTAGGGTADWTVTTVAPCGLSIGQTFNYGMTGAQQSFSVPCTGSYRLTAIAGSGGGADSTELMGKGALLQGVITLTAGDTLYIYVGGQGQMNAGAPTNAYDLSGGGYNGGGHASASYDSAASYKAGGGGGATDFRLGGTSLNDRIMVAGGGGGGGSQLDGRGGQGGAGTCGTDYCGGEGGFGWSSVHGGNGGLNGGTGGSTTHGGGPGGGGRNSGGAAGNETGYTLSIQAQNGSFGQGGAAGAGNVCNNGCGAGGGGGGWYGGGGGEHGCCGGATGAGGSSYWGGASFNTVVHTPGNNQGNGQAIVKYLGP